MLGLQLCTKVDLYGFHWLPGKRTFWVLRCASVLIWHRWLIPGHAIPHHYFNNEEPVQGKEKIHDYDAEWINIMMLARSGLVELRQPCVAGCEALCDVPCSYCAPGSTCGCGSNMYATTACWLIQIWYCAPCVYRIQLLTLKSSIFYQADTTFATWVLSYARKLYMFL